MMDFLASIENSGFSTWVREADTIFAYGTVLALHTFGMAFLVGTSTAIDLRILGFAPRLPLAPMERFFPVLWLAFWVNALTGLVLVACSPIKFLTADPDFYIKLVAIACAIVTLRLLRREVFHRNPASLDTTPVSTKAKTLAGASLTFWAGAILAGRLTAYEPFIEIPSALAFLIVAVVMLLAGFVASRLWDSLRQRENVSEPLRRAE